MFILVLAALLCEGLALTTPELEFIKKYNEENCGTLALEASGTDLELTSSGTPNHAWWRVNPNIPADQDFSYTIPSDPTVSDTPYCLSMGEIGFAINGVPIFNLLTSECKNAVASDDAETFDCCGGHSSEGGNYHYHRIPNLACLNMSSSDGGIPTEEILFGVALDGFPIYLNHDIFYGGAGLDECHGIEAADGSYRYYITKDFPYTLGCYRGKPTKQPQACTDATGDQTEATMCSCGGGDRCASSEQSVYVYTASDTSMKGCPDQTECNGDWSHVSNTVRDSCFNNAKAKAICENDYCLDYQSVESDECYYCDNVASPNCRRSRFSKAIFQRRKASARRGYL